MIGEWHDFYLLLGGASATREHEGALNLFITPTVLHFTAILVACLIALAPVADAAARSILVAAVALAGLAYSAVVWINMQRKGYAATVDLRDRAWYALAPVISYVVLAAGAILRARGALTGDAMLAFGLGLLLLAGIRNAWETPGTWRSGS